MRSLWAYISPRPVTFFLIDKTSLFQTQRYNLADKSATRKQDQWAPVFDWDKCQVERKLKIYENRRQHALKQERSKAGHEQEEKNEKRREKKTEKGTGHYRCLAILFLVKSMNTSPHDPKHILEGGVVYTPLTPPPTPSTGRKVNVFRVSIAYLWTLGLGILWDPP